MRGIYPAIDVNETDPSCLLGEERVYDDATYGMLTVKYVKLYDGAVGNGAIGQVLYWQDAANGVVTNDLSAAEVASSVNLVAGICYGTITEGNHGWMVVSGKYIVNTNGDDDIAAGHILIGVGDGTCDSVATWEPVTSRPIGIALAADVDADDTVLALVMLRN